jgi:hypothetical protein
LNVNLELLRYQHYADGFFVLEAVNQPLSAKAVKKVPPVEKEKETVEPTYTLQSHLSRSNQIAQGAFLELRDLILALEGVVEKDNQKSQITYRSTKSFAACAFNKTYVQVQFKGGAEINDPEHRAKDITAWQ